MTDFIAVEKGMPIRQPATANLMVDSNDASSGSVFNFQITKNQSLLNGYFTRIATTEVVLGWRQDNIVTGYNDTITLNSTVATLYPGSYTVADVLDGIVSDCSGAIAGLKVEKLAGNVYVLSASSAFTITAGTLQAQLGINIASSTQHFINSPDLRLFTYIDFVSEQLTYNQDLKDSSTALYERNVLCRWYFADDSYTVPDQYGFPILQGYKPFSIRRIFNPPKQIRWSPNQPLGNIAFQIYGSDGTLLGVGNDKTPQNQNTNWQMTLQVSET